MEKSINMVFIESACPSTVKDRTYDAMLTWLFGAEQRSIAVCVQVAFESMKRRFREINKMPVQDKQAYYEDVSALIIRCLDDLFKRGLSEQKHLTLGIKKFAKNYVKYQTST